MILGIWGEDKSGKSTLALTAPKPLVYMEFDIGGGERAMWQFESDVKAGKIILENKKHTPFRYPQPLPAISLKEAPLKGFKETWNRFLVDYVEALENPKVMSIVLDTGTLLWEVVRQGFLQEKQENQISKGMAGNEKLREKLLPIEYAEPNSRMRSLLHAAKQQGKNLIVTHHARDEFKAMPTQNGIEELRTGKRERSGWTGLGDVADIIVHTIYDKVGKDTTPAMYGTIDLSGVCLNLVGLTFKEPTWDMIMNAVTNMRKLKVTVK